MRVGLVLGAGGVLGGAWLTGGLEAIARETGWDPAAADYIVGTSAGSVIGSLCASGVTPSFMVSYSAAKEDRSAGAAFQLHRGLPWLGPGSARLAVRSMLSPRRHTPAAMVAGWLPSGVVSTDPIAHTIRRVVPQGWSRHPNLWVVACDFGTGRRIAFGRANSPRADLADAVAASCAIPGFYRPVTIAGRRYVDGGVHSGSNLDILRGERLDLVICLNPTSSRDTVSVRGAAERAAALVRRASGRRLGAEAKKLRQLGTHVILIQPTGKDIEVMGPNLMSRGRRRQVMDTAIETVATQLREPGVRERLGGLPVMSKAS